MTDRLAEIEARHAAFERIAADPEARAGYDGSYDAHRGWLIAMVKEAREQRDSAKALLRICADRCPWDGSAEHRDRIAALERENAELKDHGLFLRPRRQTTDLTGEP